MTRINVEMTSTPVFSPPAPLLNPLFTVTRKSRSWRQPTCAEYDCLFNGTRGKAVGAGDALQVRTGRKHEFARIVECRGHRSIRPRASRSRRAPRRHAAQRLA